MSGPRTLLIGLAGFVVTAAAILLESCIASRGLIV